MATASDVRGVALVGEAAGKVWRYLASHGPATSAQVVRDVDAPRDLVMQGIGWLAREDKLWIDENPRRRLIGLR